jgi:hypothetical protein
MMKTAEPISLHAFKVWKIMKNMTIIPPALRKLDREVIPYFDKQCSNCQIGNTESAESVIIDKLRTINLTNITPIQSMMFLSELKELLE